MLQAVHHGAKGFGHFAGVYYRHHGHAQQHGQVGGAGLAVKQAHYAFDYDQIRRLRGLVQALAHVLLAAHPHIEVVHGMAAGQLMPAGVQKVWPAFEYPHPPALARMQPRQG